MTLCRICGIPVGNNGRTKGLCEKCEARKNTESAKVSFVRQLATKKEGITNPAAVTEAVMDKEIEFAMKRGVPETRAKEIRSEITSLDRDIRDARRLGLPTWQMLRDMQHLKQELREAIGR